eukprot:10588991-Alexandrium_andersonii.AAC.1
MSASLVGSEMCIRDREMGRREAPCGDAEARGHDEAAAEADGKAKDEAVSYTHLTLPTICSV